MSSKLVSVNSILRAAQGTVPLCPHRARRAPPGLGVLQDRHSVGAGRSYTSHGLPRGLPWAELGLPLSRGQSQVGWVQGRAGCW